MEDRQWPPGRRWPPSDNPTVDHGGGAEGNPPYGEATTHSPGSTWEWQTRVPAGRPPPDEDDDLGDDEPAYLPAIGWTAGWFIAPVLAYLTWALTRSGTAPAGCITAAGDPCPPPRDEALAAFLGNSPELASALALALLVALIFRWITRTWRSGTVGLAAAVVGAGAATLLITALG